MDELNTTCPRHGDYADPTGKQNIVECPDCQHEAQKAERDFRNRWGDYEHWQRCGIPARYRSRTLDNWRPAGIKSIEFTGMLENVGRKVVTKTFERDDTINRIARALPKENFKPSHLASVSLVTSMDGQPENSELPMLIGKVSDAKTPGLDSWGWRSISSAATLSITTRR
ncbi:MAG: hypothetical protein U5L08_02690 [Xanthomonadales bacterium]|nr:hypothetical protein [Xanthomonadales bacterium]